MPAASGRFLCFILVHLLGSREVRKLGELRRLRKLREKNDLRLTTS
jgi:hypothetical protein